MGKVTCSATKQIYIAYLIHPQSNPALLVRQHPSSNSYHEAALICGDNLLILTGSGRSVVAMNSLQDPNQSQVCPAKLCELV